MAFNFKPAKQYGLLMPKKKESSLVKSNVFGDDSDEEDPHAAVNTDIKKQALQAKVKRQTQMQIDKALEQDPTVYDYDGVYDSLKAEKEEKNAVVKQKAEKKPRYIQGLMKAAEQRKREDERRQERKVQKEREKEGGEFDDKDVFITGAYRKKMQEMQELEEKERKEAEMEALLDVKNQKDMTGFYRYLLRETTGEPQPGGTSEGGPQSGGTSGGDSQSGEITAGGIKIKQEKEDSEIMTRVKEENSSSSEESEEEERNGSHKKDSHNHRSLKESRSNRDRSNSRERDRGEGHSRKDRKRSKSVDREKSHRRKDRSRSRDRNRERKRSRSKERDSDRHRYSGVSRDKSDKKHRRIEDEMDQSSRSKHDSRKRKSEDRDSKQEKNLKKRSIEEEHEEEEMILPQPPPSEEDSTKDEGVQKTNTGSEAKYSKKTSESDADAARRRYLERKLAKERARLAQQQ